MSILEDIDNILHDKTSQYGAVIYKNIHLSEKKMENAPWCFHVCTFKKIMDPTLTGARALHSH